MKHQYRPLLIILLLIATITVAFSQTFPVTASLQIQPPHNPYIENIRFEDNNKNPISTTDTRDYNKMLTI